MENLTREELKQLIKEAVREVLAESRGVRRLSREPAFLTLKQVAIIDRIHLKTAYKLARLGRIPGAKQHRRMWRIHRSIFEKQRGFAPGTMPIPESEHR